MSDDLTRSFNGSADEKLNQILSIVQSLDSRLIALEEKVDSRLRETQPLWERVFAEVADLRRGQDELRKDMRLGLHKVERQIMQLTKEFLDIRADNVMLEDRIEKLEGDSV